jgi:MFS transporter, ACS family, tartrate transporter
LLTVVLVSIYAFKGPFWALCSEWLPQRNAAAGLALVNSVAAAAAFGSNVLFGVLRDATGSYAIAMQPMTALSAAGLLALLWYRSRRGQLQRQSQELASLRQRT